jgi:hypothetical protein
MWKQIDGKISIKVIDWDSAHAVDEELTEPTRDRLQRYYCPGQLHREATVATPELDLAYVRLVPCTTICCTQTTRIMSMNAFVNSVHFACNTARAHEGGPIVATEVE